MSQALEFQPSPLTFPEPGVTMNFPVEIDPTMLSGGMQLAVFKVGGDFSQLLCWTLTS